MTRAVYEMAHLRFATAINYNAVVALLPLYLVTDIATIYFKQNWLQQVRKTFVLLITAGLLLLYISRIVQYFS